MGSVIVSPDTSQMNEGWKCKSPSSTWEREKVDMVKAATMQVRVDDG
jgi:hypothetical protein